MKKSLSFEAPDYHSKLAIKATLIISFFIIALMAIGDLFFLGNLSESKINQVENMGKSSALIVSELAKLSFDNHNPGYLHKALNSTFKTVIEKEYGFLQISVILFPSGKYYSSTAKQFNNKTIHPSLYSKIKENKSTSVKVNRLTYKIDNQSVPVLQFLQNITDEDKKRIAVTQILFDYNYLIKSTRKQVLLIGIVLLFVAILPVWLVLLPVSQAHKNVIEGMSQISKRNFNFRLVGVFSNELDLLYQVFNRMAEQLKTGFRDMQEPSTHPANQAINSKQEVDSSLRKVNLACLCARIPNIQKQIDQHELTKVSAYIGDYLYTFQQIVKEQGGQQVSILGDKIYCLFEGANAINNAIRTALNCNHIWQEINHERKVLNQEILDFGIGLHSSSSIVGVFNKTMGNYTIMGDLGRVAETLCSCAELNTILISTSMIEQADAIFRHQPLANTPLPKIWKDMEASILHNLPKDAKSAKIIKERILRNAHKGAESTIPNMLEETYKLSPLEMVDPNIKEFTDDSSIQESILDEQLGENGNRSMWDKFDVGSADGEKVKPKK